MKREHSGWEPVEMIFDKGTVGEFVSGKGAGASMREAGQLALLLSLALAALGLVLYWRAEDLDGILWALQAPFDIRELSLAVWGLVAMLVIAGVAALLLSAFRRGLSRGDKRRQIMSQALSTMLSNPRFGVGYASLLASVGLRVRFMKRGRVAVCGCRFGFQPEDFRRPGATSSVAAARSLFGAYDYEVYGGRLYVYYDADAADEIREQRYRKGARRNG